MIEKLQQWKDLLPELNKNYMKYILERLNSLEDVCPKKEDIFNAYSVVPNDVKVVILGQDPYPTKGMAHGYSFSTLTGKIPPSLRIIFAELLDSGLSTQQRKNSNLMDWVEQGVLLLNTILTTEPGKALAHQTWGWDEFTGATLNYLMNSDLPIVYLAWGNYAQKIIHKHYIDNNNLVLTSCHPIAQQYNKSNKFVGNRHFVEANKFLIQHNRTPIIWDK